jgi:hypothetical protein
MRPLRLRMLGAEVGGVLVGRPRGPRRAASARASGAVTARSNPRRTISAEPGAAARAGKISDVTQEWAYPYPPASTSCSVEPRPARVIR